MTPNSFANFNLSRNDPWQPYRLMVFHSLYQPAPFKIVYDTTEFPFRETVEQMLESQPLTALHTVQNYDLLSREKDQSTIWHRRYYDRFGATFAPLYVRFLEEFIRPTLQLPPGRLVYQKIPTFRVHLVGNVAVGEWHKDSTYNHDENEVNFWMPFTNTYDENTVWIETEKDSGNVQPFAVNYGEILVFDGASLFHGNKTNTTPDTRVSVDFRLVDHTRFRPNTAGSVNMKVAFDIGGYFELM